MFSNNDYSWGWGWGWGWELGERDHKPRPFLRRHSTLYVAKYLSRNLAKDFPFQNFLMCFWSYFLLLLVSEN